MAKIRKDDTVKVIAGKDKTKTGKVIAVIPGKNRALVQGINFVKKHAKRSRDDQKGGIIQKESPIDISNLMLLCQKCNAPTRVGFNVLADGTKTRICKKCKELV